VKIFITGNAGSGKTTLSKRLSQRLNTPARSLDKFVWLPEWKRQELDKVKEAFSHEVIKEKWIIEGASSYAMEHSEIIVFLDIPIYMAYLRVIKRTEKYIFTQRPEMPKSSPEIKILKELCRII